MNEVNLKSTKVVLFKRVCDLKTDVEHLRLSLDEQIEATVNANNKYAEANNKCTYLKSKLVTADASIKDLSKTVETLNYKISSLNKDIKDLKLNNRILNDRNDSLTEDLKSRDSNIAELAKLNEEIIGESKERELVIGKLKSDIYYKESDNAQLNADNYRIKSIVNKQKKIIQLLGVSFVAAVVMIAALSLAI